MKVKRMLKQGVKRMLGAATKVLGASTAGRFLLRRITDEAMSRTRTVVHGRVELRFATPNELNEYRASSFSTKEPETLEWIDNIPEGSVLWDIGANVGLYSCYAAKHRRCRVFAFEPSVFNLELLARNVFLNGLASEVTIVPLPLCETKKFSDLKMTSMEWGAALSTFGERFGHDGLPIRDVFSFRTIGLSIVDAVADLSVPQPDFIKMDVDGIEHLILEGGGAVLASARGVLVEINDHFTEHAARASAHLTVAGFRLQAKRHADCFDLVEDTAKYTYNQIWSR